MNQCFPEIRRQRWAYRKVLQPPWTWEALLHSQNQISYGFLSNAASSVSLNSLLFASTDSLHWTKIQEWNLITIESVLPRRPGMRAHAARDGIRVFVWWSCFFTNLQNSFWRPWAPGSRGEGNRKPVYRDSWLSYLPKLHSGRNIRDIHGRREENPSMEFPDFLLHTFILHKHPFLTTSLENFVLKWK